MKYPVVMLITTVQLREDGDISVDVAINEQGEGGKRTTNAFQIKPLDTPEDPEDYSRMASAAVCEAL